MREAGWYWVKFKNFSWEIAKYENGTWHTTWQTLLNDDDFSLINERRLIEPK